MTNTGKSVASFDIEDVSGGCNYSDDVMLLKKNMSPDSLNVEFFNGRIRKRKGETAVTVAPVAQGGIDSYNKLMLHCNGTNASTTFTDSEITPKTVTALNNAQISTLKSKFGGASGSFSGPGIDSLTVTMLHMDGVDGSTVFTDSSSGGKTFTAVGNAQIDTAQSKFGGASGLFDGTGDYITTPDSADFNFGSGDFTIEFWVRFNSLSGQQNMYWQQQDGTLSHGYIQLYRSSSGTISFEANSTGPVSVIAVTTASNVLTATNTWYHVAVVRSSTLVYIFVDGVSQTLTGTQPGSGTIPDYARTVYIGAEQEGSGSYLNGWLDEYRISKGAARFTANFNVAISAYASTGDYLTIPDSDDFNFGSGDFTIDTWVYPLSLNGTTNNIGMLYYQYVDANNFIHVFINSSYIELQVVSSGVNIAVYTFNTSVSLNAWSHIAIVRNGSNVYCFVNGLSISATISVAIGTSTLPDLATVVTLGREVGGTNYFFGYMDEFRVSKGLARWTSNFTPPLYPYDTFNASIPFVGFSIVDFSNSVGYHQQVAHLGQTIYAYDRVTNTKETLRSGAPFTRSFNAKVSSFLIQSYNDNSIPYYWDGVSTSMAVISPNAPNFKRAIEFQGYMLGMNVPLARTRCYYQPITNILGAPAAYSDYFTLTPAPNDDEISDSFLLNGRLYVGTKYSIFRVSFVGGVTVFEFKQVISDTGIVPGTAQTVITKDFGQVVLFLGTDKRVYLFDGANVKAVSDLFYYHNQSTPISLDLIDDNYKENSFSVYDSRFRIYRLFVTKQSESKNYYCLNIDVDTFAYYPFDNMQFSSGCIGYDRLLKPYLICADYTGTIHSLFIDTNTDNGSPIDEYYISPMVSMKDNALTQGRNINLRVVPSSDANLKVYDRVNHTSAWQFRQNILLSSTRDKTLGHTFVLNSSKLGSEKFLLMPMISINVTFNHYQFKLLSDSPSATGWEIYDMSVDQSVLKFGTSEVQR